METPDGKLQTITVPAGNFAVSKRPSPRSSGGAARGRKRPAAVMMGGSAAPPQADRSLYSLVSSVVSSEKMCKIILNDIVVIKRTRDVFMLLAF
jgi:hypothetical protein